MKVAETQKTSVTFGWIEKDHPVWGILKLIIQGAMLALFLSFNSTNFDSGEVRTIVYAFLTQLGLETINARRKA
jgi:hypothetical protein